MTVWGEFLCWLNGGCISDPTDDPRVRICRHCHRRIELTDFR